MNTEEFIERHNLSEGQWEQLRSCSGLYDFIDDTNLIDTIIHYAKNAKGTNPYKKFFEVLSVVKQKDYVNARDLVKLENNYPDIHVIYYLLEGHAEFYTGYIPRNFNELTKRIGKKNKRFNYDMFRHLIVNMY